MTVIRRIPATLTLVLIVLVCGVVWQGLWQPFLATETFPFVAYGLPALAEGRWWTLLTGTFFVTEPWVYAVTLPSFAGMAYLEYRRGSIVALAYFWIGQLFAITASALLLWVLSALPWPWAQYQATMLDVGVSGGTAACIAAAIGLLRAPWRNRAWLVLLGVVFILLLFWGTLDDLEHAVAVVLVLCVDRSLSFRRVTVREQRLIAWVLVLVAGAVEVLTTLVPTDGMFGRTAALEGTWFDTAVTVVVILLIARGVRRGRRWAWVSATAVIALNVVVGVGLVVAVLVTSRDRVENLFGDVAAAIAQTGMWLMLLVYLVRVRSAFRAHRRSTIGDAATPTVDDAKEMLRTHGGGTLSWMTTWEGNTYARTSGGMVAYQRRAGVALALADPLGPEHTREQSVAEFISDAEHAGLVPCLFSVGEATLNAAPEGWRSIVVADDTIVDLAGLEFTGKRWAAVRGSFNRAEREGVTFEMAAWSELSWGVQQQLYAISEGWVGDKGLPEMRFTLGTLAEAADPEVRIALAKAPNGDVDGFLSWLPVYGADGAVRGWTLDLMRRRDGGFASVMEFLIGTSARTFADEGAEVLSLSGAPLTHEYGDDAGAIKDLSAWLASTLEPVYGFQSLHRFKQKFHPRYETMYLLFRDEADLARIAAALTRAFLPDATLRQFAGAGLELVRGTGD